MIYEEEFLTSFINEEEVPEEEEPEEEEEEFE